MKEINEFYDGLGSRTDSNLLKKPSLCLLYRTDDEGDPTEKILRILTLRTRETVKTSTAGFLTYYNGNEAFGGPKSIKVVDGVKILCIEKTNPKFGT